LILNNFNDCLGFGRIIIDLDKKTQKNEVVIRNILDIGDFLRREQ
jgi:ribosome biogenesis protein Nip4